MSASAAEHVFVGIPGPELDRATEALLAVHRPGGVVLFQRNVEGVEQLSELVTALRRVLPDAVLALDAEGGRVDRLRDLVGPAPAAALLAKKPPSLALQAGTWTAQAMRLFDLDVDFAPVVDLDRGERDNALAERCLGGRPGEIVARGRAFLRGLHAGGVGGCVKHFPGLGGAAEDTHFKMACVYLPAAVLQADLEPFVALVRLSGAAMVAHAIYPAYDGEKRPASLSPPILGGLLRGRLGFDGLAFSDDLDMKALDGWGDLPERSQLAFAAGCDVLLLCQTLAALPEVVARLEDPQLEERREEASRRLDVYRQRLRTLRSARDYVNRMREGSRGERLETVRQRLAEVMAAATADQPSSSGGASGA
jgi:beta-N-acetylhexosaminidase